MHGKARSYVCLGKDGGGCGCSFVFCPEAAISCSRVVKTATKAKKGTGGNAAHAREAANAHIGLWAMEALPGWCISIFLRDCPF